MAHHFFACGSSKTYHPGAVGPPSRHRSKPVAKLPTQVKAIREDSFRDYHESIQNQRGKENVFKRGLKKLLGLAKQ